VVVVVVVCLSFCHFIIEENQSSLSVTAIQRIYLSTRTSRIDKGLHIVNDGGPSDFKLADWVVNMYHMQQELDVKLVHIVLASYHGDGPCDVAKLQANRKLKYWLLENNETVKEIETIRCVFDSTMNHQEFQVPEASSVGEVVGKLSDTQPFFFHFEFGNNDDNVFGYERNPLDEDLQSNKIWQVIDEYVRRWSRYQTISTT
jgi:hypothetical protein